MKKMPLEGVRVLDISSFYAAPFAATLLGDFGAEVIKVEPLEGDGMRGTGMWTVVARNKKSITLDLRQPEGCALLKELVAKSDVLIDNFPAKVLKARGIGYEDLSAVNPRLVQVSVSCFGQTGPYADRPGSGTIGEGFGGLSHLIGHGDGPPMMPSFPMGDAIGGMNTVIGTMMALYWRDTGGGRGQHIDATLYEPILVAISQAVSRWKPGASPSRTGSRVPGLPVRNVYATVDGKHVVISTTTQRHLRDVVELAGGGANTPDTDADAMVAAWIVKRPLKEVVDTLVAKRIPVAPVNDLDMLLADPHIQARQSLIRTDVPGFGDMAITAPSPRLSLTPGALRSPGPTLGEHNDEVFGTLLGLSAERRAALAGSGTIGK
jgi:formyl-CoA transferase